MSGRCFWSTAVIPNRRSVQSRWVLDVSILITLITCYSMSIFSSLHHFHDVDFANFMWTLFTSMMVNWLFNKLNYTVLVDNCLYLLLCTSYLVTWSPYLFPGLICHSFQVKEYINKNPTPLEILKECHFSRKKGLFAAVKEALVSHLSKIPR